MVVTKTPRQCVGKKLQKLHNLICCYAQQVIKLSLFCVIPPQGRGAFFFYSGAAGSVPEPQLAKTKKDYRLDLVKVYGQEDCTL